MKKPKNVSIEKAAPESDVESEFDLGLEQMPHLSAAIRRTEAIQQGVAKLQTELPSRRIESCSRRRRLYIALMRLIDAPPFFFCFSLFLPDGY